ncbi:MAG: DUF4136 domain-containing protein [Cyclobacteriaceae bacterium]
MIIKMAYIYERIGLKDARCMFKIINDMRPNVSKVAIFSLVAVLFSCYPGGPEFVDQLDLVLTEYDESYDFGSQMTYALPDGVIAIDGEDSGNNPPEFIDEVFSDAILDRVRQNMNANGYVEVDENVEEPDIVILASAMSTTNLYWFYDPCYWCWWGGGWWGPGYGWGYPWTPGYTSGYTTGTIFLQIVEADEVPGDEVPVAWAATINGLLQGSDANIVGRIGTTVDQAFSQSPYLAK